MSSDQIANFTYFSTQGTSILEPDYILVNELFLRTSELFPRLAKLTMTKIFCSDYFCSDYPF